MNFKKKESFKFQVLILFFFRKKKKKKKKKMYNEDPRIKMN